jgi:hypothetical protein
MSFKQNNNENTENTTTIVPISLYTVLCATIILILLFIIYGSILRISWNVSVPQIFGLPELDLTKAIGLLLVSAILLKSQ